MNLTHSELCTNRDPELSRHGARVASDDALWRRLAGEFVWQELEQLTASSLDKYAVVARTHARVQVTALEGRGER